jgi:hypothetical protein
VCALRYRPTPKNHSQQKKLFKRLRSLMPQLQAVHTKKGSLSKASLEMNFPKVAEFEGMNVNLLLKEMGEDEKVFQTLVQNVKNRLEAVRHM